MAGSGIPALSLFLLIQGSVGEGPRRECQAAEQGASSASTATDAFPFLSQMGMESRGSSIRGVSSG